MHFGEEEKPGRKAALQKLMDMMGSETGKKLSGLKKPAMAIEVDAPSDDIGESHGDDMPEDEPSEEDKAKITELYMKYCK